MKLEDVVILTDSREARPFRFKTCRSEKATLRTADYSCRVGDVDMRDVVAIERKSISDLVGSLGVGRDRFEREMVRLNKIRWKYLIIEGEWMEIAAGTRFSSLKPKQIVSPLLAWTAKYDLHLLTAPDRAYAARMVELTLYHCARYYIGEQNAKLEV